jgi:hypothetical protein
MMKLVTYFIPVEEELRILLEDLEHDTDDSTDEIAKDIGNLVYDLYKSQGEKKWPYVPSEHDKLVQQNAELHWFLRRILSREMSIQDMLDEARRLDDRHHESGNSKE